MNAIDFECPECGAKPGARCCTYTGKMQPVSHTRRKRAAFEEDMRRHGPDEDVAATSSKAEEDH